MPITKIGTRVTMTAEPGLGDSSINAYHLSDLLAASDAGGWGMVKDGDSYTIPFALYIDDETWVTIFENNRHIAVWFTCPVPDGFYVYYSYPTSHVRIGDNVKYSNQETVTFFVSYDVDVNRRRIYFGGASDISNLRMSNTSYSYLYGSDGYPAVMRNSVLSDMRFGILGNSYAEFINVQRNEGTYGFCTGGNPIYTDCYIVNSWVGILASSSYQRMKGMKIRYTHNLDTYLRCAAGDKVLDLVDCEVEKDKMGFYNSGSTDSLSEQNLITTTSVEVRDQDGYVLPGADVVIRDVTGTIVYSGQTDINGFTDSTELNYFYKWRHSDATGTLDEGQEDYEPMMIEISKAGFQTSTIRDIYVRAGLPTEIMASLELPIYFQRAIGVTRLNQDGGISEINVYGDILEAEVDGNIYKYQITGKIEEDTQ